MRKLNKLAAVTHLRAIVCALSMVWAVSAVAEKPKLALPDHSARPSEEFEEGKQAALADEQAKKPPVPDEKSQQELKTVLQKVSDDVLVSLSSQIEKLAAVNDDSLSALVDKLPPLASKPEEDQKARQALKEVLKKLSEKLGATSQETLARLARESLAERLVAKEEKNAASQNPEEVDSQLAAILEKLDSDNSAFEKKLEGILAEADKVQSNAKAEEEKKEDALDPELLSALLNLARQQDAPADAGAGGGGGSEGASPSAGGGSSAGRSSGRESGAKENTANEPSQKADNGFQDFSPQSNPENATPETKAEPESKTADSSSPRRRRDEQEEPAKPAEDPQPSPPAVENPPQTSPGLGSKSPLSPYGGGSGRAGVDTGAQNSGGTSASSTAGPKSGPTSSGGASAGDFPFSGPAFPAKGGPQKFEYARTNNYLNSSSGEGGVADGEGDEGPSEPSSPVAKMDAGSLSISPTSRPTPINQPAFVHAVEATLVNLCASGALSCERTPEKQR
jgi:hypothetical protein